MSVDGGYLLMVNVRCQLMAVVGCQLMVDVSLWLMSMYFSQWQMSMDVCGPVDVSGHQLMLMVDGEGDSDGDDDNYDT